MHGQISFDHRMQMSNAKAREELATLAVVDRLYRIFIMHAAYVSSWPPMFSRRGRPQICGVVTGERIAMRAWEYVEVHCTGFCVLPAPSNLAPPTVIALDGGEIIPTYLMARSNKSLSPQRRLVYR